jgi:hypothetical protein
MMDFRSVYSLVDSQSVDFDTTRNTSNGSILNFASTNRFLLSLRDRGDKMNVRIPASCWLFFCLVMPLNLQAENEQGSQSHSVRVQVLLVESGGGLDQDQRRQLSGPIAGVMKALNALTAEGKAIVVNHAELTALEEQKAMLQVGETVSLQTGSTKTGSGRETKSYRDVSLGTVIHVMTKVVEDFVVIEMDLSKSFVTPSDGDDPERPEGISQLTHQSTVRINNGNAQLVGSMMSRRSGGEGHVVQLIVAAEVLDSSAAGQTTRFNSSSRRSSRTSPANGRSEDRSSSGPPSNAPSDMARRRFAIMIFDRADANDDGVISDSELARLNPRDVKAKSPITKEQYTDWIASDWQPNLVGRGPNRGGRGRPSSGLRPNAFRPPAQSQKSELEPAIDGERSGGDTELQEEEDREDDTKAKDQ